MPESTFKPQIFGKYILIDKISKGGMGEVFKAKSFGSQGFEKFFAIKRILPKLSKDKSFITMLADEAKIIVSLSHSNIVPVYEFNQVADTYYLAMEFIHGKDLRALMERVDSIPFEIAGYFVAELSKGLHYLHIVKDAGGKKLGIVHRDISPRNIIVSYNGEVKIIDFGIANASTRAFHIGNDIFVGKYAYMSPEQLLGKGLTPQSDIFSAGIVLYELLFKKLPLGRMNDRKVLALGEDEAAVDPLLDKNLLSTLPQGLRSIIEKATAVHPEDRYQNALALYTDLSRFIVTHDDSINAFTMSQYIKSNFAQDMSERETDEKESGTITLKEPVSSFIEHKKVAILHIIMKPSVEEVGKHTEVLSMFQEILQVVQNYKGMIYRLHETTLITVFGLPKNKEDDVYRSLQTALEIRRYVSSLKLEFSIALTMAVDFGTVIVNFKDEDLHNFTLSEGPEKQVKDLIVVASPGDILCGPSIEHMTKDGFWFAQVERNGKHYSNLITIAHVVSSHIHTERCINRTKEFEVIDKALAEVTIDHGKTITIIGEAGIGKSALVREIIRRAGKSNIQTFVGSFHPYIKNPYSSFRQLIAELISHQKSNREISTANIEELQGYGLTPMELESIKSIMSRRYKNEALDTLSPENRKLLIFLALKKIVLGFANQKTIVVLEDLHLADELSLEALDFILANGPLPNILMIRTHRKEFSYEWKCRDLEEVVISLEPLDKNTLGNYL
jgi:serine/threonine protein kinase